MTVGVAPSEYAESDSVSCWFCGSSLLMYLSRSAAVRSLSDTCCLPEMCFQQIQAGLCAASVLQVHKLHGVLCCWSQGGYEPRSQGRRSSSVQLRCDS